MSYDTVIACAGVRNALAEMGIDAESANALARAYDPEAMDAVRYLGRVADAVERAMDAVHVPTACERIGSRR